MQTKRIDKLDVDYVLLKEFGADIDYNPACFNFSESEAKQKKLWRSNLPMPTKEKLSELWESKYKAMLESETEKQNEPVVELKKLAAKENLTPKEVEQGFKYLVKVLGI